MAGIIKAREAKKGKKSHHDDDEFEPPVTKKQKVSETMFKDGITSLKTEKDNEQHDMKQVKALIGEDSDRKFLDVDFEYVAMSEAYYHIIR